MITDKEIIEAYLFLRKHNTSISSETIEFMKDTALIKLAKQNLDAAIDKIKG